MTIVDTLREIVGDNNLLTGDRLGARSSGYWNSAAPEAFALVTPDSTDQLRAVVALCHRQRQAMIVHGGLTGVTGAEVTGGNDLIISLEKMNRIVDFDADNMTVVVEAGCTLQQVQEYALERGKLFALDIGARGSCTIGGNIATNAGGMEVIRYGMMREQVLGLEAVLADGTLVSALNKMQKNNAGYDLKQLFIGTEGTLGIVTSAVLRLHPAPVTTETVLAGCGDFSSMVALLASARSTLAGTLTRFEMMDGHYVRAQTLPGRHPCPMAGDYPWFALIEACGTDPEGDRQRMEKLIVGLIDRGIVVDAIIAGNQKQRDDLWKIREAFEGIIAERPCFLYDVSLPIPAMAAYIGGLQEQFAKAWPGSAIYTLGHMGDGNLHFMILPRQPGNYSDLKHSCDRLVYEPLASLEGSVSAEHGIGLEKKHWLASSRSEAEIALMTKLKALFDPHCLLNPGRVID